MKFFTSCIIFSKPQHSLLSHLSMFVRGTVHASWSTLYVCEMTWQNSRVPVRCSNRT